MNKILQWAASIAPLFLKKLRNISLFADMLVTALQQLLTNTDGETNKKDRKKKKRS